VKAVPRDEFDAWLAAQKTANAPAPPVAEPAPMLEESESDDIDADATATTPALVAGQPLV